MPEVSRVNFVGEAPQRRLVFGLDRAHDIRLPRKRAHFGFELLRIGPDGQARLRGTSSATYADAAVDRDHAIRVTEQRVDVDLDDFGMIGRDLAQRNEHVDDPMATISQPSLPSRFKLAMQSSRSVNVTGLS